MPDLERDRPIDIFGFSGTGNTLLVAREIAATLREAGVTVTLRLMERADPADVDPTHTIGLAFPVAVQTTYPLVFRFARALPLARGAAHFHGRYARRYVRRGGGTPAQGGRAAGLCASGRPRDTDARQCLSTQTGPDKRRPDCGARPGQGAMLCAGPARWRGALGARAAAARSTLCSDGQPLDVAAGGA